MDFDRQLKGKRSLGSSDKRILLDGRDPLHHRESGSAENRRSLSQHGHLSPMFNKTASFLQAVEGKTINLTSLTIDIVNSSNKVRTLSNEDVGIYYQTFIESTSDLIQQQGGYILKNVGDCVIAFFPCEKNCNGNQARAVLCGLALRDMIKDSLGSYFMANSLPSIECRISADSGAVAVIRIRSNGDYSAIDLFGSPMNSAAKILHLANPNQMVIGDNLFWELPREDFDLKLINRWDFFSRQTYPVYLVERMNYEKGDDEHE